jgi:hypothetical protein
VADPLGAIAPSPLSPKKIEAERPKREKTGKERRGKNREGKEKEKGKTSEMQIFSFSLLVDVGGFVGGEHDCAIMHDEGLLFYTLSLFSRAVLTRDYGARACFLGVLSHPRSADC